MRNTRRQWGGWMLAAALSLTVGWAQGGPSLSGTWKLDKGQSRFNSAPVPDSGELQIDHNDPSLKITAKSVNGDGQETSIVSDGQLNNQEFAVTGGPDGDGRATLRRIDRSNITQVTKYRDGQVIESVRWTLNRNGHTLTRYVSRKAPEGTSTWTEVYERQ